MKFTKPCIDAIQRSIDALPELALTAEERSWLEKKCAYLSSDYLDALQAFRFQPKNEVVVRATPAAAPEGSSSSGSQQEWYDLGLEVKGKWKDVILYEVPLMAIVSQCYFEIVDTDWSMDGQEGKRTRLRTCIGRL